MKLLIISHTQHYKKVEGKLVGWGPTVTEINHLTSIFEEIYHIATLVESDIPPSAIPYNSEKVKFIPIRRVGGKKMTDKLDIVFQIPEVLSKVSQILNKVDIFQFRAPTGMGIYLIPYLTLFSSKRGWFKYAGNWKEVNASFGFALQRWMLSKQSRKVTMNGYWPNQPNQCVPFENPCLTQLNRENGQETVSNKKWNSNKVNFCFVGTFYKRKGIDKILKVLSLINTDKIGTFYFVGGDGEKEKYQCMAKSLNCKIEFTGFLPKSEIVQIYKNCHFIALPSENEGFPKVIGEAMNYGCIPIVSNVSCIGQYIIDQENGFLIEPNTVDELKDIVEQCIELSTGRFEELIVRNFDLAEKFTYNYYNQQIQNKILNDS